MFCRALIIVAHSRILKGVNNSLDAIITEVPVDNVLYDMHQVVLVVHLPCGASHSWPELGLI